MDQCRWEAQRVSVQVAFHTKNFPCNQGTIDMRLSCLLSDLCSPEGSKREGMFEATKEWRMMSLMTLVMARMTALIICRQLKPWVSS